jgi:nitrogen regulatory protein PII-like uncharacterized protein
MPPFHDPYSYHYQPPSPPDYSGVLHAQRNQLSKLKEEVSKIKERVHDLSESGKVLEATVNDIGLAALQGIQNEQLEDRRVIINTLEYDIRSLTKQKEDLLDYIRNIQPQEDNSGSKEKWRCKVCTYDNQFDWVTCSICGFKRGSTPDH